MKKKRLFRLAAVLAAGTMLFSNSFMAFAAEGDEPLVIVDQGIFSAGGVTLTSEGTFDPSNQWEETGAGQTAHVDHANVLYQIPEEETGFPVPQ